MAGLVPAIHALAALMLKDVDARHKAGHDDFTGSVLRKSIDRPRLFLQHDRNAVADRISKLGRVRDQLVVLLIPDQRLLGFGADQDLQQLGIRLLVRTVGRRAVHGSDPFEAGLASAYCSGVSPGVLLLASSISVTAIKISARVFRSGASSMACFSAAS